MRQAGVHRLTLASPQTPGQRIGRQRTGGGHVQMRDSVRVARDQDADGGGFLATGTRTQTDRPECLASSENPS